jgi:hypothetical protein
VPAGGGRGAPGVVEHVPGESVLLDVRQRRIFREGLLVHRDCVQHDRLEEVLKGGTQRDIGLGKQCGVRDRGQILFLSRNRTN